MNRFCTTMGLIEEAPVVYESADDVPYAGVLLGLALLEDTHLVQKARAVYGRLNNSWYGLRSLLWTLVVMGLLRIKRVMRAEEDDWTHQAEGQPLLVVHESVDSSFREALCNNVLPEIREVIGKRRVRIVFDREGWSRELFHDLLRLTL